MKFGGFAGDQLRQIVSKIENLEQEKAQTQEALTDVYKEAKGLGFDVKVLRKLITQRKKDQAKLMEEEEILDLYKHALGMIGSNNETDEAEAA
jgi:uncharacterized protein (UPF0335 family)